MATAVELERSRTLIASLEAEMRAVNDRLGAERSANALLTELNATRRAESDALRVAADAKDKALAARDRAIDAQSELVEKLRNKKPSPWRRLGDILIGVAAGALLR